MLLQTFEVWTHLGAHERSKIRSARTDIVVCAGRVGALSDVLDFVNGHLGVIEACRIPSILRFQVRSTVGFAESRVTYRIAVCPDTQLVDGLSPRSDKIAIDGII